MKLHLTWLSLHTYSKYMHDGITLWLFYIKNEENLVLCSKIVFTSKQFKWFLFFLYKKILPHSMKDVYVLYSSATYDSWFVADSWFVTILYSQRLTHWHRNFSNASEAVQACNFATNKCHLWYVLESFPLLVMSQKIKKRRSDGWINPQHGTQYSSRCYYLSGRSDQDKFKVCVLWKEKNPTVVIFNFKKGKHIKMRKLLEKKFKRAANRVKWLKTLH